MVPVPRMEWNEEGIDILGMQVPLDGKSRQIIPLVAAAAGAHFLALKGVDHFQGRPLSARLRCLFLADLARAVAQGERRLVPSGKHPRMQIYFEGDIQGGEEVEQPDILLWVVE